MYDKNFRIYFHCDFSVLCFRLHFTCGLMLREFSHEILLFLMYFICCNLSYRSKTRVILRCVLKIKNSVPANLDRTAWDNQMIRRLENELQQVCHAIRCQTISYQHVDKLIFKVVRIMINSSSFQIKITM